MGRTQKAYAAKFCALLSRVRARRTEAGLRWLFQEGERLVLAEGLSLPHALTQVYQSTLRKLDRWQARCRQPSRAARAEERSPASVQFLCDAGLGGLARWLRAAGYEAHWTPGIPDDELLRQARGRGAIVLTTDSLLMERRVLRDGEIPSVWLPPTLTPLEQLALVFQDLRLTVRDALCMNCGGRLQRADKEALRERIPPRTYRWLDEYFLCQGCGQLFWHGTHWRKIQARLAAVQGETRPT